ncbi:leucine-rich repeat protein, partial [uncultured Ellagibacter sp.]|uniref:leucine-rich repeat protein n=1 Tax=uncultured Ellagibacter sp. TaxID=2137580 RepID=UPI002602F433
MSKTSKARRKVLACALSCVLAFGLVPVPAFAEAATDTAAATDAAPAVEDALGAAAAAAGANAAPATDATDAAATAQDSAASGKDGVSAGQAASGEGIALQGDASEATYDAQAERWATSKGVAGLKTENDNGYVEGEATPAQMYFTIDEQTSAITITGIDGGATAVEMPSSIDGHSVVALGWGAFCGSSVEAVSLPDSLEALGENAFYQCAKLRTVAWPNNPAFTTISAEAFRECPLLEDDVVAAIPASVTEIGYMAFAYCEPRTYVQGETPEPFTEIVIPDSVKRIESEAFRCCSHVRSITIGSSVEYIGKRAFSGMSVGGAGMPSIEGVEVTLPASLQSMGEDAFDNTVIRSAAGSTTWLRNAVVLRVMNPDFAFEEYEYGGTLEFDGKKYVNPFSIGQTIIAYDTNSSGEPSWIKRFADSVEGQTDEHNPDKPAYTFQWMEEQVQVTGTIPAGASAVLLQNGTRTAIEVAADGSFTAPAFTNATATVCVSLDGYYDKTFTRQASEMEGTWDIGVLSEGDFEKIPASRNMAVNVMAQTGVNEAGSPLYAPMALTDDLALTLSQNGVVLKEGEDADYVRQSWGIVLSEALADANEPLALTVVPADALRLGGATVSAKPEAGSFDVKLAQWGTATVQVKSPFAGASTVMVFDSRGARVASGDTSFMGYEADGVTPIMKTKTPQLKAGTYTVIAVSQSGVDLATPTLSAFLRMGLEEGEQYAKATISIEDGKDSSVVLEAPAFDVSSWRKQVGVKTCGFIALRNSAVVGGEVSLRASYGLTDGVKAEKLMLSLTSDQVGSPCAAVSAPGESYSIISGIEGSFDGGSLSFSLSGDEANASRVVDIRAVPLLEGSYSVSALLALSNGKTVPLGSVSFTSMDGFISLDSDEAALSGNKAQVYAKPGTWTALRVGDGAALAPKQTNALGYATFEYDLPAGVIVNERVKLTAALGDSADAASAALANNPCDTAYVRFVPRATVDTFKVTNRGTTQTLIENGKETGNGLITRHQFANKRNAYWTFDLTLSVADGVQMQDELSLVVLCMGGQTVQVPLKKREEGQGTVRFTGEYVDESYLAMVKDYEAQGLTGTMSLGAFENVFVPQTYAISSASLGLVAIDADTTVKKAKESADEKNAQFNTVLVKGSEELAEEAQIIDQEFDALIDAIAEDAEAAGATESAEELAAAIKSEVGSASDVITEGGNADGVTIDKMIFDGAYSPDDEWYADWAAAEASADPETKAAIAAVKNAVSRNDASLQRCEDEIGKMIGVGSLGQYGSWMEAFVASLQKNAGVKVSRKAVDTSSYRALDAKSGFKESDDETVSGFTAYFYEDDEEDPIYLEADFEDIAESDQSLSINTNSVALAASTYDNIVGIVTPYRKAFTQFGKTVGVDGLAGKIARNLRRLKGMEIEAKMWGVTAKMRNPLGAGLGALDAGLSCYAANDAINNYAASWEAYNQLKGDLEGLKLQRDYLLRKEPKSDDDWKCINAMNKELSEGELFRDLLEVQAHQDEANAKIAITMAAGGAAATLASGGTAGAVLSTIGAVNDASSVTANTLRAEKLNAAQADYEYAQALRERACEGKIVMNPSEMTDAELAKRAGHGDAHAQNVLEARYARYRSNVAVDPSGFVYEAVESNLVEGATAEIWVADDDEGTNARTWEAGSYEQENPILTDANGAFNWDTPTGWYQVRVTKDGYEETRSAWLPVPPAQMGIMLGLVSTEAPAVTRANAYTDCVEIEFSQYMDASDEATAQLAVEGLPSSASFEWVDAAPGADGKPLSRVLRIKPATSLAAGSAVSLVLSGARNYVGVGAEGGVHRSGDLVVGVRPAELKLNVEQGISVVEGESAQIVAYVHDASGNPLPGVVVDAAIDFAEIVVFSEDFAVTDAEGKATFEVYGVLSGLAGLIVSVGDTTLSKDVDVRVCTDQVRPARPTATLGSVVLDASAPKENYVTVPQGTKLELTAEEGATIYYSTNNTCPCRDEGRQIYSSPITLTENGYYRIAAYKEGLEDEYSERLNITVTVEGAGPGGGEDPGPDEPTFSDVDYGEWYAPGVSFVVAKGLMRGYSDSDAFGVGNSLTRAELAMILWRYTDPDAAAAFVAEESKNETGLPDVADGEWYTGAANWAVSAGVINGYEGENGERTGFGPSDPVTCEQLLLILYNLKGTPADPSSL